MMGLSKSFRIFASLAGILRCRRTNRNASKNRAGVYGAAAGRPARLKQITMQM
jgi:hypothetical protein